MVPTLGTNKRSSKWKDLPRRLATVGVGIPVLWVLFFDLTRRLIFFQGLQVALCLEWIQLTNNIVSPSAFCVACMALINLQDDALFCVALPITVALFCIGTRDKQSLNSVVTGLVLLSVQGRSWLAISHSFREIVSFLWPVWVCDTAALVAGRTLGKYSPRQPTWLHRVSPNKSVVGLVGGIVVGTVTYVYLGAFWNWIDNHHLAPALPSYVFRSDPLKLRVPLSERVVVGLVLMTAAIVGDLWESALKRTYAVKDTGAWLPGHGGILDRFDSSLLAVGIYHYYLHKY